MRHVATAAAAAVLVAATLWTFAPIAGHEFVNWDDPDVVVANEALRQPLPALLAWAFTTLHMGHYQPLSWLAFGAAGSPASAATIHGFAVALHALNAALVVWLIVQWLPRSAGDDDRAVVALGAAALFALHPLRLEPLAWASALPYVLSYAPLLLASITWIDWARTDAPGRWWTSVALVLLSQLARVTAPLVPIAFAVLAYATPGARPRTTAQLVRAVLPLGLIAVPLGALEALARDPAPLGEIGVATRLTWVLTHPALYLWRSLAPGALNPLDAVPRLATPEWDAAVVAVLASVAVVALTGALASARAAWALWGTFALLLLPVVGLVPSGLQRTADRYTYGPAMVLAVGLAAALHRLQHRGLRALTLMAAGTAAVACALSVQAQAPMWHDSAALWSRAVALDGGNDVALYNLALAEIAAGRPDAAIDHLQRLVALVPDHDLGRQRLAQLVADRETRAAAAHADARRFVAAVAAYDRALDADPDRMRARLGRGMALMELGQLERAAADLLPAVKAGDTSPAVAGALAFALAGTNRAGEAIGVLRRTLARTPADAGLAANLARLLATAEPPSVRAPEEALALAAGLNDATGGGDPRVLDTLAVALAANGRRDDAARAWATALAIARENGDAALVAAISASQTQFKR